MNVVEREWIEVMNDTVEIVRDIMSSNVGDSAFSKFDASQAFGYKWINKAVVSRKNEQTTNYTKLGEIDNDNPAYVDTIKENFGKIYNYRLRFFNQIEDEYRELEFNTFTTLRKPTKVEWNPASLAEEQIKIKVSEDTRNTNSVDSIILYRHAPTTDEDETIVTAYNGQEPMEIVDSKNLTQGLFYHYTAAYYDEETGLSRVSSSKDTAFAKLSAPQFIEISDGENRDTIFLEWNKIPDAVGGYNLYSSDTLEATNWELFATINQTGDTAYADTEEHEECKRVYYKVQAIGHDTTSALDECETTFGSRAFRGVKDLVGVDVPRVDTMMLQFTLPTSVILEKDYSGDANFLNGVKLMRYDAIDSINSLDDGFAVAPDSFQLKVAGQTYTITDNSVLEYGNLYFYRVVLKVKSSDQVTEASNIATGWLTPRAVTNVRATAGDKVDTVLISWDKLPQDRLEKDTVSNYIVVRCDVDGNEIEELEIGGEDSTFSDFRDNAFSNPFEPCKDYKYLVKAKIVIAEDTVYDGQEMSDIKEISPESNLASGWSEMQPLSLSDIDVIREDTVKINHDYPPTLGTGKEMKIQFLKVLIA